MFQLQHVNDIVRFIYPEIIMSNTGKLTRAYGSFFSGCTQFAFLPYTQTFKSVAESRDDEYGHIPAALLVTGFLSFIVPVLPALTAFTSFLAVTGLLLAAASMFLTYPIALVTDMCSPSEKSYSSRYAM